MFTRRGRSKCWIAVAALASMIIVPSCSTKKAAKDGSAKEDEAHALKGALKKTLGRTSESVTSVVFSPDSKTIASAELGSSGVKLRNVQTGALKLTLENTSSPLAFSPDGHTIVTVDTITRSKSGICKQPG